MTDLFLDSTLVEVAMSQVRLGMPCKAVESGHGASDTAFERLRGQFLHPACPTLFFFFFFLFGL